MKVLAPAVTCVLTSHMKPTLRDALHSVVTQTRLDVQIIVVDSGQWHRGETDLARAVGAVYKHYADHPLVEWYSTGESGSLRDRVCPVAWATNQVIRAGLVRGTYVCTFYDDDRYEPTFMEKMTGYLDEHPEVNAVWCSQWRAKLVNDGAPYGIGSGEDRIGEIVASGPKYGGHFDQLVDGAQVLFRRELLDRIGDPWLPESPLDADCRHSDGVFLDRIGHAAGVVHNIPEHLVTHRFTPLSAYSPMG